MHQHWYSAFILFLSQEMHVRTYTRRKKLPKTARTSIKLVAKNEKVMKKRQQQKKLTQIYFLLWTKKMCKNFVHQKIRQRDTQTRSTISFWAAVKFECLQMSARFNLTPIQLDSNCLMPCEKRILIFLACLIVYYDSLSPCWVCVDIFGRSAV